MGTLGEGESAYLQVCATCGHCRVHGSRWDQVSLSICLEDYLPSYRVEYNRPAFFFFFNEKHLSCTYHK